MKLIKIDKKLIIPMVIALVGALLILITVFLPYTTATDALKSEIEKEPSLYSNISMLNYAKIHAENSKSFFNGNEGYIYTVFVSIIGVCAILSFIFSVFKKPIPTIVLTVISFAVFAFQSFDFSFRGEINDFYIWGYGYYLFYIASALVLIGAIWMLIAKIKAKKEN